MYNFQIILIIFFSLIAKTTNCQDEDQKVDSIPVSIPFTAWSVEMDKSLNPFQVNIKSSGNDTYNVYLAKNLLSTYFRERYNTDFPKKMQEEKYFELATDQDVFSKTNMDRDYTMGVRLQWYNSHNDFWLSFLRLPFGKKMISKILKEDEKDSIQRFYSAGLTHSAFTPEQIHLYEIDLTDRPYAGVMALNSTASYTKDISTKNKKLNYHKSLKFSALFGLLGKFPADVSAFMQAGIHAGQAVLKNDTFPYGHPSNMTRVIPRGWLNAIGNKTNFVIYNYTVSNTYGFSYDVKSDIKLLDLMKFDVGGGANVSLGNLYTNAGLFITSEIGWYEKRFFSNESNVVYDAKGSGSKKSCVNLSFILNAELNYWVHNSTLQGNLFNDRRSLYKISRSQVNDWTLFYEYGLRLSMNKISITYLNAFRSPVISLDPERIQNFGRIILTFKY